MRRIIAISGIPGTGKSTLMKRFMSSFPNWEKQSPAKLVETLYNKDLDLHILGKYEDGETFPGTDKLSMACQPEVTKWIESTTSNVLYEGDRLTGPKFYDFLLTLPDTRVTFAVLKVKPELMKERYEARGSDQSEKFIAGRQTKIDNILTNFDYAEHIIEFNNNDPMDCKLIIIAIDAILQGKNRDR